MHQLDGLCIDVMGRRVMPTLILRYGSALSVLLGLLALLLLVLLVVFHARGRFRLATSRRVAAVLANGHVPARCHFVDDQWFNMVQNKYQKIR